MSGKRWFGSILVVLLAATFAWAQEPPSGEDRGEGDRPARREARRRPAGDQDRPGPGGRRGEFGQRMGGNVEEQMRTLTEALKLDEAQQESVKAIVDDHMKKLREVQASMRPSEEEMERMRTMREAMREAREAGDDARIDELREENRKYQEGQRGRMEKMQQQMEEWRKGLHEGLVGVLHEDQKADFEKLWKEHMERPRVQMRVDPRQLKRVVDALESLSGDQKDQIANLFRAHQQESREIGENDRRAVERSNRKLFDDVMKVLNDEQKAKVQREMQARAPRGGEGGRFERQPGERGGERRPPGRERPGRERPDRDPPTRG